MSVTDLTRAFIVALRERARRGLSKSVEFVSAEYDARPVQPLNPQAALAEVNAFRAKNGLKALVLDARLKHYRHAIHLGGAEQHWPLRW